MEMSALFFINSLFLGFGLSMDAFSVSLVNGLSDPQMGRSKAAGIAMVFALFQAIMPLTGWVLTHTVVHRFGFFSEVIPLISLGLLMLIGLHMLLEDCSQAEEKACAMTLGALMLQGVATSLDALSVGFTIAEYGTLAAVLCAGIIAAVTFCICFAGVQLGRLAGCCFSGRARMLGGLTLIAIGIEIFLTHIL